MARNKKKKQRKNMFQRKRDARQKEREYIAGELLGIGEVYAAKFRIYCAAIAKSFNYETNVFGTDPEQAKKNAEDQMKMYADNLLDSLGIPRHFRIDCQCVGFSPLSEMLTCKRNEHGRWVASYGDGTKRDGDTEEEAKDNLHRYILTKMMPKNLDADQHDHDHECGEDCSHG